MFVPGPKPEPYTGDKSEVLRLIDDYVASTTATPNVFLGDFRVTFRAGFISYRDAFGQVTKFTVERFREMAEEEFRRPK